MASGSIAANSTKIEELIEGWHDELPDDLAQYGPKLRQVATDVDADLRVHISHIRLIDSAINGILILVNDLTAGASPKTAAE